MSTPRRLDLGAGVGVTPLPDANLLVRSARLRLPWSPRRGAAAGTAVLVDGTPFEAVERQRAGSGEAWTLRPWPEDEAMRVVVTLDEAWVAGLERERADDRAARRRWWLLPVVPLLGLAPASLQSSWELRWGFPATTATLLSALAELALSTLGVVHTLAAALGGGGAASGPLAWLGLASPLLLVESIVRLKHVSAAHEPIGSVVGLPLSLLATTGQPAASVAAPEVRCLDREADTLELRSGIHRADWSAQGVLWYRDQPYRLASVGREGRDWIYLFSRADATIDGPALRLLPPADRPLPVARERPPSLVRSTIATALACLAPRDLQEAWAGRIAVRPVLLTVLGAGVECCGALVNLHSGAADGSPVALAVNLMVLVEGAVRFALLIGSGRPAGSLLGVVLRRPLARLLAANPSSPTPNP
ncbi:MAG TPA: hypothetical protein PKJ99_00195 [Thermoanaerobaculales bacterium]|nr:hypothetical protein [Thermoanaerobaculales bacterium]HPA79272.1 hypothetical protein [Thermoanaerobaculales bacterium]HQL29722.1 hypothetical protein [Thermoanaerobaculales bacterium]HQN95978.1 hypothetical protein [Thermoanaerobaculales bacterium]HQP42794.1 hypothetical protein [Thermoanaerobaculales bacterium]